MKTMGPLTWCRLLKLYQQGRSLPGIKIRNACCIFSRTGVWNPRLNHETRLEIEKHWKPLVQEHDERKAQEAKMADNGKPKFYALSMFPYPSGNLHLGHVRVYTISDVLARHRQANGKAVIHPMGWDAFGLPAENAAIERGIRPRDWTYSNIKKMKQQIEGLGLSFDWSREIATCDPSYYKWTQWIFLKMFEKGLAFQKKGLVNWDPEDMTVLADEQIDDNGCSWRSGAKAEQRYLTQWYLRTTVFSKSLLDGLDEVDPTLWRDIISLQKNWISECRGHRTEFQVSQEGARQPSLSIYTEDLDLIYGISHIWLKPSHYMCVDSGLTQEGDILPMQAIHPLTGQRLSLVVTSDPHMFEHQEAMLGIPSISTVAKDCADKNGFVYQLVLNSSEGQEYLTKSQQLSGLTREEAVLKVQEELLALGAGGELISERLKDWLISRQRYWGTPIPIIHCDNCGAVPVPYEDLPVELPDVTDLISKNGKSPLAEQEEWLHTSCPNCGRRAKRETDTMDTFVDSTWYFLRYLDPHNDNLPCDPTLSDRFMPVDLYVGGKEHAVLHLYFARFVCHFLHSLGLLPEREPFRNLLTQGMVKGESYRIKDTGKYISVGQVDMSGERPVEKDTGAEVITEFEKMSKSKYNGVDPEDVLKEFGIDSTRLCIVSNVSPQSDRNWSNEVYKGVLTWQGKVWTLVTNYRSQRNSSGAEGQLTDERSLSVQQLDLWERKIGDIRNFIINNVNRQMDTTFLINSAISRLHSYTSWLAKVPAEVSRQSVAYERALADLVLMMSPMAPHFCSELWAGLRACSQYQSHDWTRNVLDQCWPQIDTDFLMPLTCRINNVDICEVGVPYKDFDQLTTEVALSLVQQDPTFVQVTSSSYTPQDGSADGIRSGADLKPQLALTKGYKAVLTLRIQGLDLGVDQTSKSSEKSKQAKKLSKKKKKLHTMTAAD